MSSIRRKEYVHEELLEERLRILLESLGWTYAALWTLNPRTRVLEWKRGCFNQALMTGTTKEASSATSTSNSSTVWDAHLFFTTYKSCSFAPSRTGAIGRANLELKHIWLTGDAVCKNAVSSEQSQFLSCSKIQTMICIPWVDSVLEIGTAKLVGENVHLMDQIQEVLSHDLLEPNPFEHAPPAAPDTNMFEADHHHSSHVELPTNLALQQPSSISERELPPRAGNHRSASFQSEFSLSDQVWRSGNSPNSNIYVQGSSVLQPTGVKENLSFTLETGTTSTSSPLQQMPIGSGAHDPALNWKSDKNASDCTTAVQQSYGLMVSQADQYRSWSGATTTSSRVSSQSRDLSARPSVSSDQLHQQFYAKSSTNSRYSEHDRQQQQLGSPYSRPYVHQIRRTTSWGDGYEVKKALSLYEAQEMQDQWHQQLPLLNPDVTVLPQSSPSPEPTHYTSTDSSTLHLWQRDGSTTAQAGNIDPAYSNRPTVKRSSNASLMNQVSKVAGPLLRRRQSLPSALEVLKAVDNTFQMQQAAAKVEYDKELVTSKLVDQTCEDQLRPSHDVQMTAGPNLRGRRRSRGVEHPGPVHTGHEEAAVNHMLMERRRRVKQKENLTALRRLVPIISKADKASTLQDAIAYLQQLQTQIQEMEARKEDIDEQCQALEHKCKKLEQRNQDLLKIISKEEDQPTSSGTPIVHLNQVMTLKLQSIKSI